MFFSKIAEKEIENNAFLFDEIDDEYVKKRIKDNFDWYVRKAVSSKYLYYFFSVLSNLFPILSTIAALSASDGSKIVVMIIAPMTSMVTYIISLMGFSQKWTIYRDQAEQIKRITAAYTTKKKCITSDNCEDSEKNKLITMLEIELSNEFEEGNFQTHKKWLDINNKEKEEGRKTEKEEAL